ncbi:tRNA isopentenyl-2-thiomethyl-A-37 hydroxylase MiaE [Cellvibrio sp. KY-GH-1]|uniref:tRNA isopentenyl-2-thiomethyl-A-37 hydroxylase MiaE n=1 Tax=Cellvibrio sp. KY-GH-1 TaxID=2303332 RepID=UPI001CD94278|nr:tRNA isopentenyl-2-thiomethyl-A-37 hydroxylase MiaE [Cellvibrio sp. KY-GH-1]
MELDVLLQVMSFNINNLRLLKSEARHYEDYLTLAKRAAEVADISARVREFLVLKKALIEGGDEQFRFHSGGIELIVIYKKDAC